MSSNALAVCLVGLMSCTSMLLHAGVVRADDGGPVEVAASAAGGGAEPRRSTNGNPVESRIRDALKSLNPDLAPDYIGPSSVPGYQEVIFKGQVVFVTDDGKYLAQGLMDLGSKRDLSQSGALPGRRRQAMEEIPLSERIVFAPSGPVKYTVAVFTDVECGFCRKLHQDIAEYNKLGIAIEYVAFPRAGIGSEDAKTMASVWCASDRRKALTDAKSGVKIPPLTCNDPIEKHYRVGQRVGLQGTPMIINADGIALPGYLPPAKMLEALDGIAEESRRH